MVVMVVLVVMIKFENVVACVYDLWWWWSGGAALGSGSEQPPSTFEQPVEWSQSGWAEQTSHSPTVGRCTSIVKNCCQACWTAEGDQRSSVRLMISREWTIGWGWWWWCAWASCRVELCSWRWQHQSAVVQWRRSSSSGISGLAGTRPTNPPWSSLPELVHHQSCLGQSTGATGDWCPGDPWCSAVTTRLSNGVIGRSCKLGEGGMQCRSGERNTLDKHREMQLINREKYSW